MDTPYKIERSITSEFIQGIRIPSYYVLIFEGNVTFSIDFNEYSSSGKSLLLLSPNQFFRWVQPESIDIDILIIYNDFYGLGHNENGVTYMSDFFKSNYDIPYINVSKETFEEIHSIIKKIKRYKQVESNFDISIFLSYLQVILALSARDKENKRSLKIDSINRPHFEDIIFQNMLEENFLNIKKVSFYASQFGVSVGAFNRKIKSNFGKAPSKLIQERVILEAKRKLHLTNKSIKEIAGSLNFNDELYFSRYFKKQVGISPKYFRKLHQSNIL
jgi:AraC family transcriptional activator of pobA